MHDAEFHLMSREFQDAWVAAIIRDALLFKSGRQIKDHYHMFCML
jgi:hypothetical protein